MRHFAGNFLLASGNAHKAEEFNQLFEGATFSISPAERKLEVEETGTTFQANALLKAEAYYREFGGPVMADDSGLVVAAIPDELGIYSARFGGGGLDNKGRAMLLLECFRSLPDGDQCTRQAYFVCVLCFYLSPEDIFFFEGRLEGEIGAEYKGEHGFGYDPIFIPTPFKDLQETLAQHPEWKKEHSHRSLAAQKAKAFFSQQR